ncbi:hypothetical protein MQX02_15795 [Acinetobacter baumannii]|uniref:hypothetical protein n=1 Tax=Acinetobacter baumannii TaxID=470 RepID=UPI001F6028C5|nr:hypothetical protein [Acinetobacter baumannii]MCI3942467.1 hypothetical protein [Acinetobacter baumannii]
MNLLRQNEDEYILLDSNINYSENTAYISLEFLNAGQLMLKSTDLLGITDTSIYLLKDNKHIEIQINPICDKEICKLQFIFRKTEIYELNIADLERN